MSIHAALSHRTRYTYDRPVQHGPHVVRLRPAPHCKTKVLSYSLKVGGGEVFINWQQDPFSNWNARLVFPKPMREFVVEVELVVEMAVHNPFDFFLDDHAKRVPFAYETTQAKELAAFFEVCPWGPRMEAYVEAWRVALGSPNGGGEWMQTIDFLVELNQALQRDVSYLIRMEPGVQSPEETLRKGSGSCRDSAWLMCQILRGLGFASRFVSGYLIQLKPDLEALDGPSGTTVDFTDLHAWCEVFLPGAGWIGFDPTSGLLAGEGHIPLSCTPEPGSAAPVSGLLEKCESRMEHSMNVSRIFESPRVTLPYSDAQWANIMELGRAVDARLLEDDVRLTMGGEPTFVSIDRPDGPEWNHSAVSQEKRVLSGTLLKRLQAKFSPGALLHYGQGKWYPGEPLPRYALSAFWRRDGVPVWKDPGLIADESKDYGHGVAEAKLLGERLARILGLGAEYLQPAYEDSLYYQWRESRLPFNVAAEEPRLAAPGETERFRRLFKLGLKEEVGYVLPLQNHGGIWRTSRWHFKEDGLLRLVPGDSPIGYRLPLDSLPWVSAEDYPHIVALDPSQELPSLPSTFGFQQDPVSQWERRKKQSDPRQSKDRAPVLNESASWIVRTALCVEPRHGRLHVFLPPFQSAEVFVELIAALEQAVRE
ncbi:MAG: IMP dehydrogenase, partial [Verrucomicrobia bacterium]|nr:IMP dehydrogenase [Verrucomicrobiota bacterium]